MPAILDAMQGRAPRFHLPPEAYVPPYSGARGGRGLAREVRGDGVDPQEAQSNRPRNQREKVHPGEEEEGKEEKARGAALHHVLMTLYRQARRPTGLPGLGNEGCGAEGQVRRGKPSLEPRRPSVRQHRRGNRART